MKTETSMLFQPCVPIWAALCGGTPVRKHGIVLATAHALMLWVASLTVRRFPIWNQSNLPGPRRDSLIEQLHSEEMQSSSCCRFIRPLWNHKRLTNGEVLWITDICFVRFEDRFPTFRGLIELPRNRNERIARLHNVALACFLRSGFSAVFPFRLLETRSERCAFFQLLVQR